MRNRLVLAGSAVVASVGLCTAAAPAMALAPLNLSVGCGDVAGLIAAVGQVNGNADGGTITLAEDCAYRLQADFEGSGTALPAITGKVAIVGDNSTLIRSVRDGLPYFRILAVGDGGQLTLKGVSVTGGHTEGDGAGILNEGTLRLENSKVAGNQAGGEGGGIANEGGEVTLVDSSVLANVATSGAGDPGYGGGLSNDATGTLTLKKSTVAGNTADEDGGGIQNHGTLTVDRGYIVNNEARDDDGGGINNLGTATIKQSRITENWAGIDGGGIANGANGTLEVEGSFLLRNKAGNDGGGLHNEGTATLKKSKARANSSGRDGGGINNEQVGGADAAQLTLERTTVSENRAAGAGGGVNNRAGAVVTLTESEIAENLPTNCAGTVPGCS